MKNPFLLLCQLIESILNKMSKININNSSYEGKNISIINNKVYIDGKLVDIKDNIKEINIIVEGDLNTLESGSGNVIVKGNAESVSTGSGNVRVDGLIKGDVKTGSGNVNCSNVNGNVKTGSGDIITRK